MRAHRLIESLDVELVMRQVAIDLMRYTRHLCASVIKAEWTRCVCVCNKFPFSITAGKNVDCFNFRSNTFELSGTHRKRLRITDNVGQTALDGRRK